MASYLPFLFLLTLLSCQPASNNDNVDNTHTESADWGDSIALQNLFTRQQAERILGESMHVTDSTLTKEDALIVFKSTYTAADTAEGGKIGNLYVMIEHYRYIESARQTYTSIYQSNQEHEGIEVLQGVGDEAYFHSDGENFLFVLARKGGKVLRMKVNKITSHTSRAEFDQVTKEVVEKF